MTTIKYATKSITLGEEALDGCSYGEVVEKLESVYDMELPSDMEIYADGEKVQESDDFKQGTGLVEVRTVAGKKAF